MQLAHFEHEQRYWDKNIYVIGVDEVGRGCLAGDVHVGATVFEILSPTQQEEILKLKIRDSKKCTTKLKETLFPEIEVRTLANSVQSATVLQINETGIVPSIEDCMLRAIKVCYLALRHEHKIQPHQVIVFTDSIPFRHRPCPLRVEPIPKGDLHSITIAAASILAKVTRDNYMKELHCTYPQYAWDANVGYATAKHCAAINEYGPTAEHRTLFLRKLIAKKKAT